jgi:hypothetical protein
MFKLTSCAPGENGDLNASYSAEDKDGTFKVPVRLIAGEEGAKATVELGFVEAPDEDGAFTALADLLERSAQAIRSRGEATRGLPVYGG